MGTDGEAFDFVCLQKLCAFEFGHNSAKSFEAFLPLRSGDTAQMKGGNIQVEAKLCPDTLEGKHS